MPFQQRDVQQRDAKPTTEATSFPFSKKIFLHKLILMAMIHVIRENTCNTFKDVHVESGYIDAY